ncbi:MAG: hypothetical protein JKY30_10000 [Flavobacteriales bacterium]|nr:hypothetical protein [Flavobacteriales bacterium]
MGNKKIINTWIVLVLILTSHFGWSQAAIIKTPELNNYEIKFEKEKMAYNNKVAAKVKDFYNYLEIISNPKIEEKVRIHTIKLTKKLFLYNVEVIDFLLDSVETVQLDVFLASLLQSQKKVEFSVSDVLVVSEEFAKNIKYNLVIKRDDKGFKLRLNHFYFIHSIDKKFGNKSKQVVTVSLGKVSN